MQYRWFGLTVFVVLFTSVLVAQQAGVAHPAANDKTPADSQPHSEITPNTPVITINGFCDPTLIGMTATMQTEEPVKASSDQSDAVPPQGAAGSATNAPTTSDVKTQAACRTVVTRAQFEKLAYAMNSRMRRSDVLRLAARYPETLVYAQKAQELGIDKDPRFQERVHYAYLQALSLAFIARTQDQAKDVSDADVAEYYKQHPDAFEELDVMRIFVPKWKEHGSETIGAGGHPRSDLAADEAEMKAEAEKIRKKAVAGGNFDKLEAEVYKFVNDPDSAPDVHVGKVTHDSIPAEYETAVFQLQPGQISELVPGPRGWHILKVLSKRTVPLSEAKPHLQRLRIKQSTESLKATIKTQYNDAYFNDPGSPVQMESNALE